jgi:hypothetical protein
LTNRDAENNGLRDLFEEGKHLILYEDAADLLDKAAYYLEHEQEREAIARAGMELVRSQHRYLDRADRMLSIISDAVPALDCDAGLSPHPIPDPLVNFVPFGAPYAVDVGGRLAPHASALRARGVESIVDVDSSEARSGQVSVLAVDGTPLLGGGLAALDHAYGILSPGGTLLIRLTAHDFSTATGITGLRQLEDVFAKYGFHVTHLELEGASDVIVRARKRTRRLREIVRESCEPFPHLNVEGLCDWAANYGPDY